MAPLILLLAALPAVPATPALNEQSTQAPASEAIRRFRVSVPDSALVDLRRRIAATRWPDQETVPDQSQGAQLAMLQALVQYWGSGYTGARRRRS
jgi:hypothetical protein